jgi:hypothetical protein
VSAEDVARLASEAHQVCAAARANRQGGGGRSKS